MLYWTLGTLAFFAVAMALAQPTYRSWGKVVERLLLAGIWPLVLFLLLCWVVILLVYTVAKRLSGRNR